MNNTTRAGSPDHYSDCEIEAARDDFRPISPDRSHSKENTYSSVGQSSSVAGPSSHSPRVEAPPRWTDRAAVRIQQEQLRKSKPKKKTTVECKICKYRVGPNQWLNRWFLNQDQLELHQRGKDHLKELRKLNDRNNRYYCFHCNKSFTGPGAKNNYTTHCNSERHRRAVNKSKNKKSNIGK